MSDENVVLGTKTPFRYDFRKLRLQIQDFREIDKRALIYFVFPGPTGEQTKIVSPMLKLTTGQGC